MGRTRSAIAGGVAILVFSACLLLTYMTLGKEAVPPSSVSAAAGHEVGRSQEPPAGAADIANPEQEPPESRTAPPVARPEGRTAPIPWDRRWLAASASRREETATPGSPAAKPLNPLAWSLLGTVKDTENHPVAGAKVSIRADQNRRWLAPVIERLAPVRTDARGSFVLGPIDVDPTRPYQANASYPVSIEAPGYYPANAYCRPGEEREVILEVPGSLGGVVVFGGQEGRPCPDAMISLMGPRGDRSSSGAQATSDGAGRFFFASLRPGEYSINILPRAHPAVEPSLARVRSREHTEVRFEVEKGITVRGRVIEYTGDRPVTDAMVFTSVDADRRALTGPNGVFCLDGLPREVTVKVYKQGYLPAHVRVTEREAEEIELEDVKLMRPASVTGVVLGPDGEPVELARVSLIDERIYTDAQGKFTIPAVWPDENLRVRASKRGYLQGTSDPFAARPGETVQGIEVRIELRPPEPSAAPAKTTPSPLRRPGRVARGTGVVSGRVQDAEGKPVVGARVEIFRSWVISRWSEGMEFYYVPQIAHESTRTSEQGEFRFEGLPPAGYFLGATAKDFLTRESATFRLAESAVHQEVLTLEPGFFVRIECRDEAAAPLRRASVIVTREKQRVGPAIRARTDGEGGAQVGPVGKYAYRVALRQPGRRFKSVVTRFDEGQTCPLRFERISLATRTGEITGTVVFGENGASAPSFWIRLLGTRGVAEKRFADASGRFTWSDLKEGMYQVEAGTEDGHVTRDRVGVEVRCDAPAAPLFFAVFLGGRVEGAVLDPAGKPVAGARVTFQTGDPERRIVATTTADPEGRFKHGGLAPGHYVAIASHERWVEGIHSFTIGVGRSAEMRIALLDEGGTLRLTAIDERGRVVPNVDINIYRATGEVFVPTLAQIRRRYERDRRVRPDLEWGPYFLSFYRTDGTGRLLLPFLPPGHYRVMGNKLGMTSDTVEFQVFDRRATPVTLALRANPELDGR